MSRAQPRAADHDDDHAHEPPKSDKRGKRDDDDDDDGPDAVRTRKPGGSDALGKKENVLSRWYDEMAEVAHELAPQFEPLGLHFRPQILLATAMQEASAIDPLNARSFDNGLGIMQITPFNGRLDGGVARALRWDNSKSVSYNIQHSRWRDAKSNLRAGAFTMLGKASAIKGGVPQIWSKMDEQHRWRAVLYAYNAGQGSAISALRRGGPNASMISTYTINGRRVSHDYTKEIKAKMDYVDRHDPFEDGDGRETGPEPDEEERDDDDQEQEGKPDRPKKKKGNADHLKDSVGRGGDNRGGDVRAVQRRLRQRHVDPGPIDGLIGPLTIGAIERFQSGFLDEPDGLIEPGKTTERHLFGEDGRATPKPKPDRDSDDDRDSDEGKGGKLPEHPGYATIAKNFSAKIPGSNMTWHEALWLPSWGRHVRPSDVTNAPMDTVLDNIQRQAHWLTKVSRFLHRDIVVHCWLRPPRYNVAIGGAGNSSHMRGTATDFHMNGISAEAVRRAVKNHPDLYPGAGENSVPWVHLDLEHQTWFEP